MNVEQIHIEFVAADGATVPEKAHADDAAFDLRAYLPPKPCANCDGKGGYVAWREDESDGNIERVTESCHDCDGEGVLESGTWWLHAGSRTLVPTGIRIALPAGVAAFVLPRSGLAFKHGITVANSPGLIDPGYRGEIGVILSNISNEVFTLNHGDRIAQLLPFPLASSRFFTLTNRSPAEQALRSAFGEKAAGRESGERGEGGFGSTGL